MVIKVRNRLRNKWLKRLFLINLRKNYATLISKVWCKDLRLLIRCYSNMLIVTLLKSCVISARKILKIGMWWRVWWVERRKLMSNNSSNASSGGIGFCGLLTIVFIVLKLLKVISWSWVWVLCPLWIPFSIVMVAIVIMLILSLILHLVGKNTQKKSRGRRNNGRL